MKPLEESSSTDTEDCSTPMPPAVRSFAIESFDDWRKLLVGQYVRLGADRTATGPFCGHIDHARCGGITLSTMVIRPANLPG
jgi:hypothetical protein